MRFKINFSDNLFSIVCQLCFILFGYGTLSIGINLCCYGFELTRFYALLQENTAHNARKDLFQHNYDVFLAAVLHQISEIRPQNKFSFS